MQNLLFVVPVLFLQKLKEQLKSAGLEQKVVFLGRVDRKKLVKIYQGATIYVVSSIYEGLPTVLLRSDGLRFTSCSH